MGLREPTAGGLWSTQGFHTVQGHQHDAVGVGHCTVWSHVAQCRGTSAVQQEGTHHTVQAGPDGITWHVAWGHVAPGACG